MPLYKIVPAARLFISDTTLPAEDQIGRDPKDPGNVAYTLYNKPYSQFQWLGGFNIRPPIGVTPKAGDVLTVYADNSTTNAVANSLTYTYTFTAADTNNSEHPFLIGMSDQAVLGVGLVDVYGNWFDGITTHVFRSAFITQTLP